MVSVGGLALKEEKIDESIIDTLFIPYNLPLIEVENLFFLSDIGNDAPKWLPDKESLLKFNLRSLKILLEKS